MASGLVCKFSCCSSALKDNVATDRILLQIQQHHVSLLWIVLKGPGTSAGSRGYRRTISNVVKLACALCEAGCQVLFEASSRNRVWSVPCLADLFKHAPWHSYNIPFCALNIHAHNNTSLSSYQHRVTTTLTSVTTKPPLDSISNLLPWHAISVMKLASPIRLTQVG